MELELAILKIIEKTDMSIDEIEGLTVAQLLKINKKIKLENANGVELLNQKEIILTEIETSKFLKAIDITKKLSQKLPKFKPIKSNYQTESLDSQIANIKMRVEQSNKMLEKE